MMKIFTRNNMPHYFASTSCFLRFLTSFHIGRKQELHNRHGNISLTYDFMIGIHKLWVIFHLNQTSYNSPFKKWQDTTLSKNNFKLKHYLK